MSKVIAIDFDGTITTKNSYPVLSEIRPYCKEVIAELQKQGYFCYLWTCRIGKELDEAIEFLKENGIELDAYNDGPSTGSRKLVASYYIDDRAWPNNGDIDWLKIAESFGIKVNI